MKIRRPTAKPQAFDNDKEAEALAKIQRLCLVAGMSAEEGVARATGIKEIDDYEINRYKKLRQEALEIAKTLTDDFYRSSATHFLVRLCMKADDVDDARALFAYCEVEFIREKIVEEYPQLATV